MIPSTKNAILLVRVSTEQQDYDSQIYDLKNHMSSYGYNEFKIIQTKESGLADLNDKLGANELFKFISENPKYNTVVATEMSRLGRRQSVLHEIKERLYRNRIQLYVKDSNFWLLNENGKVTETAELAFTMFSLFAESEIKRKKDRFARARKDLMAKGYSISGKTLFGYKRVITENGKTTLIKDDDNAFNVLQIFNWYAYGIDAKRPNPSIQVISQHCLKIGLPKYTHSKRNVNKLLKEEGYTGFKVTNNKRLNKLHGKVKDEEKHIVTRNKIKYPMIVNKYLFQLVQEKLDSRVTTKYRTTKHTTILSNLIKCPKCNRSMVANYRFLESGGNKHSYRCSKRTDTSPCGNNQSLSMSLVDSGVWNIIKMDWQGMRTMIEQYNPNIEKVEIVYQMKNLEDRLNDINVQVKKIVKMLKLNSNLESINLDELIHSSNTKLKKLDKEKINLGEEYNRLESRLLFIKNNEGDAKKVMDVSIPEIEKDKELIKKYVSKFVNSIEILLHDRRYTIIKLQLKYFTKHKFSYKSIDSKYKSAIVIFDKKVTQKVKCYYTTNEYINVYDYLNSNSNNKNLQLVDFNLLKLYSR